MNPQHLPVSYRIAQLHRKVKDMLQQQTEEEIARQLQQEGLEPSYIEMLISNVQQDEADRRNFRRQLLLGILITIASLLINYVFYLTGYISFWALLLIAFGISAIIRPFINYRK